MIKLKHFLGAITLTCCLFVVTAFAADEEETGGFDFSDTVMILEIVEDKYLLSMLRPGSSMSDMHPNYHFTLFYHFLAKYGPTMVPLELGISKVDHQFIVVKPESEILFTLGDHLLSNGELIAPIEDKDYKYILWLMGKSERSDRLTEIENVKEFAEVIKNHHEVLPVHGPYDGKPLQLSTRRTEIDEIEAEPTTPKPEPLLSVKNKKVQKITQVKDSLVATLQELPKTENPQKTSGVVERKQDPPAKKVSIAVQNKEISEPKVLRAEDAPIGNWLIVIVVLMSALAVFIVIRVR